MSAGVLDISFLRLRASSGAARDLMFVRDTPHARARHGNSDDEIRFGVKLDGWLLCDLLEGRPIKRETTDECDGH